MRYRRNTNKCCCPLRDLLSHQVLSLSLGLSWIWAFAWVFPGIDAGDSQNKSNPLLTSILAHKWSFSLYELGPASCILLSIRFPTSSSSCLECSLNFTSCLARRRWMTCSLRNTRLLFPQCWRCLNTFFARTLPQVFADHLDRLAYAQNTKVAPL